MRTRTPIKGFTEEEMAYIAHAATLMSVQETQRSSATLVTSAMTINTAQKSGWKAALSSFPMHPDKAQKGSDTLNSYLRSWKPGSETDTWNPEDSLLTKKERSSDKERAKAEHIARERAKSMLEGEVSLINTWVRTLNLRFDNISDMQARQEELKTQIRNRIFKFYRISVPNGPRPY